MENKCNFKDMKTSEYSAEIKTELLQITEAFRLGSFIESVSFLPSTQVEGYILTKFVTTKGIYEHFYRIKE